MRLAALIVAILAAALFSAHDASGQGIFRWSILPGYGVIVATEAVGGEQRATIGINPAQVVTISPMDTAEPVPCAQPYQLRSAPDWSALEVCDGIGGKRRVLRFDGARAYGDGDVRFADGGLQVFDAGRWVRLNVSVAK